MSLTIKPLREAIVAKLLTVPAVGQVHAFEPLAANLADLKRYYQMPGKAQLRGWYVRRFATNEVGEVFDRGVEYSRWRIRGYAAVGDDGRSELEIQDLVEAMRDSFRKDGSLGGLIHSQAAPSAGGEIHLQLREFNTVMFCDVLCHSVLLELSCERFLNIEIGEP